MKVNKVYTVEYSVVQHCYHIDTLDKTLQNNAEAVVNNLNNGFLIIGIFKNYEAASDYVDYHRGFMLRLNQGRNHERSVANTLNQGTKS
jgi:hypothetical protein